MMQVSTGLYLLVCCLLVHSSAATLNGLDVTVLGTGAYEILVDGVVWFNSTPPGFHSNGVWYDVAAGNLKMSGSTLIKGTDGSLGAFTGVDVAWMGGSIPYHTIFQFFEDAIVFNQYFPAGVPSTATGTNSDVISAFPTISNLTALNYFTYQGWPFDPMVGQWPEGFPSSIQGGSPALFFNNELRSVIFSPLSNQMVGLQTKSAHYAGSLACGIQGMVEEIPANFTHRTILVAGQGINNTFSQWGDILLSYYGKNRAEPDSDILIQYLGYWTDNGAYYYYNTEPNKTYSETMIDVYKYVQSTNLPVQNYQFDSWWYFKGINDGVSLWEPMPSVFPEGMLYVDQNMGNAPLALHNRYFSPDNQYLKNYSFAVEATIALPLDEALFTHIMGKAQTWGMILYEQDWLVTTYTEMKATQNNVTNARNWLLNMGNAASNLGLTIQYCMPLPLHILQSAEIQSVTQTRVSNDYNPANTQWQIGFPSILVWSLGLYPFKDDFWSSGAPQPGCKFSTCTEPNPVLETLAAALTTGPIGPSDSIGFLDVDLIMQTCTKSGLLLKSDKPSTALDSTFLVSTTNNLIQVWDSFTQFGLNRWHYVLGAGLTSPYTVSSADVELNGISSVVFDYFAFATTQAVSPFGDANSLVIPAGTLTREEVEAGVVPFKYYVIAPVLQSKWVFLGETNKFITVSKQRIATLIDTPSAFSVTLIGTPGETITLTFYNSATSTFSTLTPTFATVKLTVVCLAQCVLN